MLLFRGLLASHRADPFPAALAREADSDRGKENEGTVNEYEILLMLDPELAEERQTEIVSRTHELVDKGNGTWLSHDVWGRRRLAYEIDHKADGTYHLLQFDAEPTTLDEITRVLKITEGVMRHLATRRVKGGGRAAPPPLPPVEERPRHDREERRAVPAVETGPATEAEPAGEAGTSDEAEPVEPETAVAEPEAEGYAEPTQSEQSEASTAAPEEEA
jgi:small subunit ribosomal protein S6